MLICMEERPLNREEIEQLRRNLARLSEPSVENAHREAYKACEMKGSKSPQPVSIQQLVQAWRQLWMWRRKR
jgi:hypothetical protein